MNALELKQIEFDSADYHAAVALRQAVLRTPLGLVFTAEELAKEAPYLHCVAVLEGNVVGSLMLVYGSPVLETPSESLEVQLRQMAVQHEGQSLGIGSRLLGFAESLAKANGATVLWCNARQSAQRFYEKNGFQVVGDPFTLVELPHIKMQKSL
ncbi:MAG: GNAT family N-acetyltransferase [Vampirovibrionales bacterium]